MNEPIKTASQIIKEKGIDDKLEIDTSKPYPEGLRRVTREAMEEYANQQVACERKRIKEELIKVFKSDYIRLSVRKKIIDSL